MKKILGITAALATVLGFSQVVRVHAEGTPVEQNATPTTEVATPEGSIEAEKPTNSETQPEVLTQFSEIQTHAKINMTYEPSTNEVYTMKLKFGGVLQKDLIDTKNHYGILVLDTKDYDEKQISELKLTPEQIKNCEDKKIAKSIDDKIKEQQAKAAYEVYWVIKNTLSLGYNRSFTAALYEVKGETVTLSKGIQYNTLGVVEKYLNMKDDPVVAPVIPVLQNFKENYKVEYKLNVEDIRNNTKSGNKDHLYYENLYAWIWSNDTDQHFERLLFDKNNPNVVTLVTNHKHTGAVIVSTDRGVQPTWGDEIRTTSYDYKLVDSKISEIKVYKVNPDQLKKALGNWSDLNPVGNDFTAVLIDSTHPEVLKEIPVKEDFWYFQTDYVFDQIQIKVSWYENNNLVTKSTDRFKVINGEIQWETIVG